VKNAKIVRVAEWDGWCGACAADRPLVLTRTGRQRLRTWLAGAADDSRPLVLTCRLCGTGVDVPLERDDPAPVVDHEPAPVAPVPSQRTPDAVALPVPAPAPAAAPTPSPELTAGRQVVAQALGALLAQRSAAGALTATSVPSVAVAPVAAAPALPLQRTASSGGLAELQLLADGIDLLSSGRA
jgi:hypothetical protein